MESETHAVIGLVVVGILFFVYVCLVIIANADFREKEWHK